MSSYQELLDQFKKAAPYDWPRIHGLIVAHRIASVRAIRARPEELLLEQGVHPKVVAEMLGHSTIAITLNLYSHVTPTMQREAARAMDFALGNS